MLATLRRCFGDGVSRSSCWNPGMSEPASPPASPGTARRVARVRRSLSTLLNYLGRLTRATTHPTTSPTATPPRSRSSCSTGSCSESSCSSRAACPTRELFALERPASWKRALGLAGIASSSIYVFVARVHRRPVAASETSTRPTSRASSRTSGIRAGPAPFVAFFLAVTLLAPFVEELTYRGLGFSLLAPYGVVLAILATGRALRRSRTASSSALPVLTFFGIAVGWLRAKTEQRLPGDAPPRRVQRHRPARLRRRVASVSSSSESSSSSPRPHRPPRDS